MKSEKRSSPNSLLPTSLSAAVSRFWMEKEEVLFPLFLLLPLLSSFQKGGQGGGGGGGELLMLPRAQNRTEDGGREERERESRSVGGSEGRERQAVRITQCRESLLVGFSPLPSPLSTFLLVFTYLRCTSTFLPSSLFHSLEHRWHGRKRKRGEGDRGNGKKESRPSFPPSLTHTIPCYYWHASNRKREERGAH